MTVPLSPDEGVRVEPTTAQINSMASLLFETWKRVDPNSGVAKHPASYMATFADMARAVLALPAPSTPVPVIPMGTGEGLPRGSASGADGGWQDIDTAPQDGTSVDLWVRPHDAFANGNADRIPDAQFRDGYWWRRISSGSAKVSDAGTPTHWRARPAAPPEPGAGAASALPSQGEPVAEPIGYTNSDELADIAADMSGLFWAKKGWSAGIPLYTAEALAAERARAEELQGLYDAAIQMYRQATDREGRLAVALAAAEARADRAEEALKPFAGDTMPSLRRTEIAFDRNGLRRSMSPMEIAMLRARTILKETAHDA